MKLTRWINFVVCLPYTLAISYPYVLLMVLFGAAHSIRMEPDGTLTAVWMGWVTKPRPGKKALWRWSTTLGHGIVFQAGLRPTYGDKETSSVWDHEFIHVFQTEDLMMISLIVGALVAAVTGNWILGLALWTSGGLWQSAWFLTAGLRHGWTLEGVYRQSEHERSARAQTQRWCGAKSWLQVGNRKI